MAGTQTQPNTHTHTPAQGGLFAQSSDFSTLWRGEKWGKWGFLMQLEPAAQCDLSGEGHTSIFDFLLQPEHIIHCAL